MLLEGKVEGRLSFEKSIQVHSSCASGLRAKKGRGARNGAPAGNYQVAAREGQLIPVVLIFPIPVDVISSSLELGEMVIHVATTFVPAVIVEQFSKGLRALEAEIVDFIELVEVIVVRTHLFLLLY